MHDESWKQIWERKGHSAFKKGDWSVADLFAANGYDSALGKMQDAGRVHIARTIKERLGLERTHRLLEVGCGAGAILFLLRDTEASLCGVDYSAPHLDIAKQTLPSAEFRLAEACALPFGNEIFDRVLSNGVFLYFSSLEYAQNALSEMLRVANPEAKLLVMDLPDAAKQTETEQARRAAGASLSPAHLYYPKEFFVSFATNHSRRATIFDQEIEGYGNAEHRFNVLLE